MTRQFQTFVDDAGLVQFDESVGPLPSTAIGINGLFVDTAGSIYANAEGDVARISQGLPMDIDGRVVITRVNALDHYGAGAMPYDADNRIVAHGLTNLIYQKIARSTAGLANA